MIFKHLSINGFHCYDSSQFDFGRQTTVLMGKNGTGKSSLLKAVCNSLSFIFSDSRSWGFSTLSKGVPGLGLANIQNREIYHDAQMNLADYISLHAIAQYDDTELDWTLYKTAQTSSALQTVKYKEAYIAFMTQYEKRKKLPTLSYYSDRYPHINTKLGSSVKEMLEADDLFAFNWGYYQWNEFTSCTEIWQKRFIKVNNQIASYSRSIASLEKDSNKQAVHLLQERIEKLQNEVDYVTKYIKRFTDNTYNDLSDKSVDLKVIDVLVDGIENFYIKYLFANGTIRRIDELPAGYERLFSMIFDVSYRSYILNGGEEEPFGIVIIDELDLHLHPSLGQDVLQRMKHAFPKIQFIISTHSPLVISNFRQDSENIIIKMEEANGVYTHQKIMDIYGIDYNMVISSIMDTEPRNPLVEYLKCAYVRLARREKKEEMQRTLQELKNLVSESRMQELMKEMDELIKNE